MAGQNFLSFAPPPSPVRLVPAPAPEPAGLVSLEARDDGRFVAALVRHGGTTVAAVTYTRAELAALHALAGAALGAT